MIKGRCSVPVAGGVSGLWIPFTDDCLAQHHLLFSISSCLTWVASCLTFCVWIAIFNTNFFWCALQRVLGPNWKVWISLDINQFLSTGLRMRSLTVESGSLENYTTIGLKVVSTVFVLEQAKPHDYSKKKKQTPKPNKNSCPTTGW